MKLEVLKKKFNQEEKNRLEKLIEVVKYSDPMSNGKCQEVESQIMNKMYILENSDDKLAVMEEMENLFEERNQKIKLWK